MAAQRVLLRRIFLGVEIVGAILTLLFALPTAWATYDCNFNGRMCQYSLYGPSDTTAAQNIRRFSNVGASDAAYLISSSTDLPNNEKRADLSVADGDVQTTIFTSNDKEVISMTFSDDRRSALLLVGMKHTPTARFFTLDKSNRLIAREYEMYCFTDGKSSESVAVSNLDVSAGNVVSFDFKSNCNATRKLNGEDINFNYAWQDSGRVLLTFDKGFFLSGVYPNVEWKTPPTQEQLQEKKAAQELIQKQIATSERVLNECAADRARKIVSANERNYFYVCEVPAELDGQPTYWKLLNDRKIIAGPDVDHMAIKDSACDADGYLVRKTPTSPFFGNCKFGTNEYQIAHLTFVDPSYHVHHVKVECACWEMELTNFLIKPNTIEFDAASSSPKFKFDGKETDLGGAKDTGPIGDISYRGRVTINFYDGGWMKNVKVVTPQGE